VTNASDPLWVPSPTRAAASAMAHFAARAGQPDSVALHRWSVSDAAVWSIPAIPSPFLTNQII
jgi:hypothetical protein